MSASERCIEKLFLDMRQKYIEERERMREKFKREGKQVIFVHELCECSEKRKMRQRFPDIERAEIYNPRFAIGQLIEEALRQRFGGEERKCTKELVVDGKPYLISGMIDIVEPEEKIPIEVKYQTSIQEKPLEHHILQLKLYLWLIGSERGELIYVSPEGLKFFIVREPLTEREVVELIKDRKSPRWPEWECQYCPYHQFCNRANCRHRK
jgi:CRISPR-associated exonuclease Cas4